MPNRNPHYKELKRYLAEVAVGRRSLELPGLAKRVDRTCQSGVSSLDICELFQAYAHSSPSCKQQKLSEPAAYLLETIQRLDREDYDRLIGPGFRKLTDDDLSFLQQRVTEEVARRHAPSSPSCTTHSVQGPRNNVFVYG